MDWSSTRCEATLSWANDSNSSVSAISLGGSLRWVQTLHPLWWKVKVKVLSSLPHPLWLTHTLLSLNSPSKAALGGTVAQTRKCARRSSWSGKAAKYILSPTQTTSSSPLSTGRCASLLIITFSLFFYIPSQIEYTWSIVKHQSILIFSLIGFSAATISPFWSSTWEYSLLTGMLSTFIIDHFLAKRCRWKKIVKKNKENCQKPTFPILCFISTVSFKITFPFPFSIVHVFK